MTIESASTPAELDTSLPAGTDFISEGDNHVRLLKTVLKNFAGDVTGKATLTEAQAQTAQSNVKYMTVLRTWEATTARIASQSIAEGGVDDSKLMTSLKSKQQIDARLATQTQAEGNTDNTQIMTSLRTYQQVTNRLADQTVAETGTDNILLMTALRVAQSALKVFNDNFTSRTATTSEAEGGSIDNKLMTPLKSRQHGDARYLKISQSAATGLNLLGSSTAGTARGHLGLHISSTYGISNSVTSSSTTTKASSAAAKTAYDRGTQALNVANSKLSKVPDTYGGVGAYLLAITDTTSTISPGGTTPGSNLEPFGFVGPASNISENSYSADFAGTWKLMAGNVFGQIGGGLWLRIS